MLDEVLIPTYTFPELVYHSVQGIETEEQNSDEVYLMLSRHSEELDKGIANALQDSDVELFDRLKGDRTKLHELKKLIGYYVKADTAEKETDEDYYRHNMSRINNHDCYKLYWAMKGRQADSPVFQALCLLESATRVTDIAEVYQARDILRKHVTKEL